MTTDHPPIHALLCRVAADVGAVTKDRVADRQAFRFRGIDDLMNALHPLLAAHGVALLPAYRILERYDRSTKAGGLLEVVIVEGTFTFAGPAGDAATVTTIGQASDSSDKATNKAMSAALKYALIQTFTVPTQDMDDADQHVHEISGPTPVDVDEALARVATADKPLCKSMAQWLPTFVEQGRLSQADADRIGLAIESRLDAIETEATA